MKTSSGRAGWTPAIGAVKGPSPGRTATGEMRRLPPFGTRSSKTSLAISGHRLRGADRCEREHV